MAAGLKDGSLTTQTLRSEHPRVETQHPGTPGVLEKGQRLGKPGRAQAEGAPIVWLW